MGPTPNMVVFSLNGNVEEAIDARSTLFRYNDSSVKVPGPWKRGRPKGSVVKSKLQPSVRTRPVSLKFEFVNVSTNSKDIDESSRLAIRRHVRRKESQYLPATSKNERGVYSKEFEHELSESSLKLNLHQIQGVDPFDKAPIKMEPYMHDLLRYFVTTTWKHFYSLEEMAGYNPIAEYWMPLAFRDSAYIHSLIGCAEAYISSYKSVRDGSRALTHLQAAISIINHRLEEEKDVVSIGTLTVIATIALLEKGAGHHDHWQVHMQGLQQVLKLHGGIESLISEPLVLHKLYRADLYGSLDSAQLPYFSNPYPLLCELPCDRPFHSEGLNTVHRIINLDNTLRSCIHQLEDAMQFWGGAGLFAAGTESSQTDSIVPQKTKPTPKQAARVRYLLTSVQYTLVSTNYPAKPDADINQRAFEFCRVILILYTMTILNERAPSAYIGHDIGNKFRTTLLYLTCPDGTLDSQPKSWRFIWPIEFHLWAMYLLASVMMYIESETKDWLLAAFTEFASPEHAGIRDLQELKHRLSQYLWVSKIHDLNSKWLWSNTVGSRRI
ncbi:hypothetical protein B0O99DRAFT_607473 [Bisporella sp. PMI_857]|nr:hypothetical protein B0O99DRAFT_607473 [Bisporella sp. PMI_857]